MRPLPSLILHSAIGLLGVSQSSAFLCPTTCISSRKPTNTINLRSQYGHERFSLKQQLEEEIQLETSGPIRKVDDDDDEVLYPSNTQPLQSTSQQQIIDSEFYPILALCFCVTLLSALDRVAMSIAILPISSEFGYTETMKGQISSAVSYGYGAAILPIGLAVSVVSARLLMMVGVFLWSLATLGTPVLAELSNNASILFPLLSIRAIMGSAEAVVLPTMQRILANWVPPEKKATTLAIILSGFQLGTVSAYLVSPWLMDQVSGLDGGTADIEGWRGMFYIYGIAGLVWLLPWYFVAKDSPFKNSIGRTEDCTETFVNTMVEDDASLVFQECLVENDDKDIAKDNTGDDNSFKRFQDIQLLVQSAPWADFLRSPGVWGMMLAHAAKNFELYNLLAWTPTFFSEQYGLNTKESALFSIGPSICGMIGGLTAGNLADFLLVKLSSGDSDGISIETRTNVRKLFQSVALFGPAACLFLLSNLPEQVTTAQILLGGAVGLQAMDAAGFGAATQEKAGERWAGLLYSLTSLPGVMIGSISVSVTGQILDMMSSEEGSGWTTVFQLNSMVCIAGAFCFLFLYDSKREFD